MTPRFTLAVVTTADGFIARYRGQAPQSWASAEEQDIFFAAVSAADWSIMGRGTHEAARNPSRRRIVFSTSESGWRNPNQLWLNPERHRPHDLPALVGHVHALRNGLILGGTRVHDWFLAHGAIDEVHLTVEPLRFGAGLPVFSGQGAGDPVEIFLRAGFAIRSEHSLNHAGTRLLTLCPAR